MKHYGFAKKVHICGTTLRAEDLTSIHVPKGVRYRHLGERLSYKAPLNMLPKRRPGESPLD